MGFFEEDDRLRETGPCEACQERIGNYYMFWYGRKILEKGFLSSKTRIEYSSDGAFLCKTCIDEFLEQRSLTSRTMKRMWRRAGASASFESGSTLAWVVKGEEYRKQGCQFWTNRPRWFDT